MKRAVIFSAALWFAGAAGFAVPQQAHAQASGHASVGLGHGEEGYLHLEEMIKHLEYGMKMPDAGEEIKTHGSAALTHAREARTHYMEALKHASEALGRKQAPLMDGPGGEGSHHEHEEGSGRPPEPEGSHH